VNRPSTLTLVALLAVVAFAQAGCSREPQGSNLMTTAPIVVADEAPASQTDAAVQVRDNRYSARFGADGGQIWIRPSAWLRPAKFTVEMWVKAEALGAYNPLLTAANTNEWNSASGFGLKYESNRVYLGVAVTSNLATGHYAPYVPPLHRWVHLAGTFDGTTHRVNVDGELVREVIDARPVYYDTDRGTLLGAGHHSNWGGPGHFKGLMDEVRVWDHARSGDDIRKAMRHDFDGPEPGLLA
jgi:hypothetical protein